MNTLQRYLPAKSVDIIFNLIAENKIYFQVTPDRKTKYGDYRYPGKITINSSLNKYAFFLTTVHELAHFFTYKKYRRKYIKPHGIEWKNTFKELMSEFNLKEFIPQDLLIHLNNYMINPKASTNSDTNLYNALRKYDSNYSNIITINDLKDGDFFKFGNEEYLRIEKRRKLVICIKQSTKKKYLFKPFTEIFK